MSTDNFIRIHRDGRVETPPDDAALGAMLAEGEALHRQLRPDLQADYFGQMRTMFGEGARIAQLFDDGQVRALALWRVFHTTYCGRRLEVEDLVTDDASRSRGHGAALLDWLEAKGRELGCPTITLHSAVHRARAHRFYFRQGFHIMAFHFSKAIGS